MQSFASMTRSEFYVCRYTIKNANFTKPITVSHPLDQRFTVNQTDDPRVANKEHQLLKEEHGDYAIWTAPHSQKKTGDSGDRAAMVRSNLENPLTTIFQLRLQEAERAHPFIKKRLILKHLLPNRGKAISSFGQRVISRSRVIKNYKRGSASICFTLNQGAGRDGRTNFAAKGLTGEGYEGHYFWDTEMYLLPFYLHQSRHCESIAYLSSNYFTASAKTGTRAEPRRCTVCMAHH